MKLEGKSENGGIICQAKELEYELMYDVVIKGL